MFWESNSPRHHYVECPNLGFNPFPGLVPETFFHRPSYTSSNGEGIPGVVDVSTFHGSQPGVIRVRYDSPHGT